MKNKVKPLPKEKIEIYFGQSTKKWQFDKLNGLTEVEDIAIKPIVELLGFDTIYAIPEVKFPQSTKTPDAWANESIKVEIKEISSAKAPDSQLRKAKEQIKGGGFVILDMSNSVDSIFSTAKYIRDNTARRGVSGYVVKNGVLLFGFSNEKDPEGSFRYESKSQKGSKTTTEDESSHIRIISRNDPKIKSFWMKDWISHNPPTASDKPTLESGAKSPFEDAVSQNTKTRQSLKKSAKYWRERSLARTRSAEKISEAYIQELRREYEASANRAAAQIKKFYLKTGADPQKIKEITPNGQLSKFLKEVRNLGLELPENYQWRVNREEFLQAQLWLELQKLGVFERTRGSEVFESVIRSAHEATMRDYGVSFSTMNDSAVRKMLDAKFAGENFKTRIDERSIKTFEQIKNRLTVGLAKGEGVDKMVRDIRDAFGGSEWKAERLVRTEVNHFENASEIEAYRELGIEWFEFMAYLDGRTSDICRELDGEKIKVRDAVYGENVPPCHPNCRSTIVAVFEGEKNHHSAPEISDETPIRPTETGKITKHTPNHADDAPRFDYFERMDYSLREFNSTVRNDGIVDYSKLPRSHPDFLEVHEQDAYERLIKKYGRVERVPAGKSVPTNDFRLVDYGNLEIELKSVLGEMGKMTIRNEIYRATDKGKRNVFVDLYYDNDLDEAVRHARRHISIEKNDKKIDKLVISKGNTFIEIK